MKILVHTLILIFFTFLQTKAQQPFSKEFTAKTFKAHPLIWDMAEDSKGVLWFANNEGILRYDGNNWHLFKLPIKSRSIRFDQNDNLYIAGAGDFGKVILSANGNFSFHSLKQQLPIEAKETGGFEKVISLNDKEIYFYTANYLVKIERDEISLLPKSNFNGAFAFKQKLYVNTAAGLALWQNQKTTLVIGSNLLSGQQIISESGNEQGVYLATNQGNIYYFDGKQLSNTTGELSNYAKNGVLGIQSFFNGEPLLAVATLHHGVKVFNQKHDLVYTLHLASNEIYSIGKDHEQNLWIGHQKGIHQTLSAPLFELNVPKEIGTINQLSLTQNQLLMAATGGLFQMNLNNNQAATRVGNISSECWQIETLGNVIYVASTEGVYRIEQDKITLLLAGETILRMQVGNISKQLYLMGINGIWKLNYNTNSIQAIPPLPSYGNSIYETNSGILIGTFNQGIVAYKTEHPDTSKFSYGETIIRYFNNEAYIQKAKSVFDLKGNAVDGIPFQLFSGSHYLGNTSTTEQFNLSNDGLNLFENNAPIQSAYIKAIEGRPTAIAANKNGYYLAVDDRLFYGEKIKSDLKKPLTFISYIEKNQQQIAYVALGNSFTITDNNAKPFLPEINYNETPITLEFGINSFGNSVQNEFSYQISGINENWSAWQKNARITLPQLGGGTHTINLKARNAYGIETEISSFDFYIKPPWYLSSIAYLCYLLGAIICVYLIIVLNQRQLRTRNKVLEQKVHERTSELITEKAKSDSLLLNILPQEVAEELKNTGSLQAKQFDEVSIIFTDFVGFTTISEKLTPKELVEEIHHCFKAFDAIIEKNKLEKIKTIGDAYMAVCGMPIKDTDHAKRVAQAALDIKQFIEGYQEERKSQKKNYFEIRIGINSGPVIAGIVGVKKYAYDIWGDTVNTAARMEQNCEAGKINISGSTYELIKSSFNCSYRGKIDAKNKGMIDMYYLLS